MKKQHEVRRLVSRRQVLAGVAGVAVALSAGSLTANALWYAQAGTGIPSVDTGAVRFASLVGTDEETRAYSVGGEPVTVTLPGSKIIEVLEQSSVNTEPVIWRFTAAGAAVGITGLDYTVSVVNQLREGADPVDHALADGYALKGTVMEQTVMKVYPAAAGGDCSAVPATPVLADGEKPKNVYLFDNEDVTLQEAGAMAADGADTLQEWCVALNWMVKPDGRYANDVFVTGTAADGTQSGAKAGWESVIGYPASLDPFGEYRNKVTAEGTADDDTLAKHTAEWYITLYPDPSNEPGIVLALDPVVTSQATGVDPRD